MELPFVLRDYDLSIAGKTLLQNVSLTFTSGNYGILGKNGVGKSLFLQDMKVKMPAAVYVRQEMEGSGQTAMQILLESDEKAVLLLERENKYQALQALTDDYYYEELEETRTEMREYGVYTAEKRAFAILRGLGFGAGEIRTRAFSEYSGGWRKRLCLASALFVRKAVLLLDEPTNHLDLDAVIWLESYLRDRTGLLLLTSHDATFIRQVCTKIIHFNDAKGLTLYKGGYAHYLKEAPLGRTRPIMFPQPCKFNQGEAIIQMRDVSFSYEGENASRQLLDAVDFGIYMTSRLGIVGENGCGKTTLLKLIAGALVETHGEIYREQGLRIATFHQHHLEGLPLEKTPVDFLAEKSGKKVLDMRKHLGKYGICGNTALQTMKTLSGGQKSRVTLAAISFNEPHLLILDEPTNNLDMDTVDSLVAGLREFMGAIIVVSHHQHLLKKICTDLLYINKEVHCVNVLDGGYDEYKRIIHENLAGL